MTLREEELDIAGVVFKVRARGREDLLGALVSLFVLISLGERGVIGVEVPG